MTVPKHEATKKREKKPAQPQQPNAVVVTGPDSGYRPSPSMQHDINHVAGLADVEESSAWIARAFSQLTSEERTMGLSLGQQSHTDPAKVTLADKEHDDTTGALVTALD